MNSGDRWNSRGCYLRSGDEIAGLLADNSEMLRKEYVPVHKAVAVGRNRAEDEPQNNGGKCI